MVHGKNTISDNVGIGSTSPDGTLHVHTASAGSVTPHANADDLIVEGSEHTGISILTPSTNFGFLIFGDPSNPSVGQIQYSHVDDEMNFITNDTQQVVIKSSGNVGIGTVEPNAVIAIENAGTDGILNAISMYGQTGENDGTKITWQNGAGQAHIRSYRQPMGGSDMNTPLVFSVEILRSGVHTYTDAMFIAGDGNVGIGQANPVHKIDVVGTAGLSTGTAWTNTSDIRFKNIQSELTGSSLEKVMALRPVSFTWSELHDTKYGKDPGLKYGFIAQDVQKVIPEFISQDNQGYLWYNPSGMEAILTAAIQEQQKEIEQLRREVAELREKVRLNLPGKQ